MSAKRKRKVSEKRTQAARKLARTLPRDKSGKFLPRGSKNLFRKRRKRATKKKTQRKQIPRSKNTTMKRRRNIAGIRRVDEFPNFLTGQVLGGLAPVFATQRVDTPIPRLTTFKGRSTVMELLWMDLDVVVALGEPNDLIVVEMTTSAQTQLLGWQDTRVIMFYTLRQQGFLPTGNKKVIFVLIM